MSTGFPFAISVVFVTASVLIAVEDPTELPSALATGSFFGLCAVVLGTSLLRRRRTARSRATPALVHVPGGVPLPMRRGRQAAMAGALLLVGTVGAAGGSAVSPAYAAVSGVIALAGAALGVAIALRRIGDLALRFEPEGLWLERRDHRYRLPWDGLEAEYVEIHHDGAVRLYLAAMGPTLASVTATDPSRLPHFRERVRDRLERSLRWNGAHEVLFPWRFGLDPIRLVEALERYRSDPASREALRPCPGDDPVTGGRRLPSPTGDAPGTKPRPGPPESAPGSCPSSPAHTTAPGAPPGSDRRPPR